MKPAYAFGIIAALVILAVFPAAYAAPTTGAATGANSMNLTFHCTGATNPAWIQYGRYSGSLIYRTENITPAAGVVTYTQSGLPLMSSTLFYFRCCDTTGCGSQLSATLSAVTPNPTTTYRRTADNISASHLDPAVIAGSVVEPYRWTPNGGISVEIVIGILLMFVFVGLWLRQKEVLLPTLIGLIGSGMLFYSGTNSAGVPKEFLILAAALVALGLTGVITGLFKR